MFDEGIFCFDNYSSAVIADGSVDYDCDYCLSLTIYS